jgi:CDP-2,3-bis-(O-geranylgeranyl)-sn-glycerol synthase
MHPLEMLQLMVLLALANSAPIIAKKIIGRHFSYPLDAGVRLFDQRSLFGPSKTVRGLLSSILVTTAGALLVGLQPEIGVFVASAAMAGDLFSSFIKRRLNFRPSSQAVGLDQVPESLLPLLACRTMFSLTAGDIALGVAVFFIGELILSRFLYAIHLRDEPY